jgi:hypothetical protein
VIIVLLNDICTMEKLKAVITADVVNSSLLWKAQMDSLKRLIEQLLKKNDLRYIFYRGDSFNAVCEPGNALRISCLLRTLAIPLSDDKLHIQIDIRMAIGIGVVEEPFKSLSLAKGEAFVLSGREMDKMEKLGPRLSIRCADPLIDTSMAAIALFTDYLIRRLTIRQAQVIHELMLGSTQMEVAGKLRKSQSTINKHAKAAGWRELERIMEIYKKLAGR